MRGVKDSTKETNDSEARRKFILIHIYLVDNGWKKSKGVENEEKWETCLIFGNDPPFKAY